MPGVTVDPRVEAYLAALPAGQRDALSHLRAEVRTLVPEAVETISYGLPTFKLGRRLLLSYAGWKAHCSLYPLSGTFLEAHKDEVAAFKGTKGSLHFTAEQPLPDELLAGLVRARLAELDEEG